MFKIEIEIRKKEEEGEENLEKLEEEAASRRRRDGQREAAWIHFGHGRKRKGEREREI
jgi:hypothetical protein